MSADRQYSKLKGIGGHVVWTDREVAQVPFYYEGVAVDQREWAIIKVVGRDYLLRGMRLDTRVQTSRNTIDLTVDLVTGNNIVVPDTTVTLVGTAPFAERTFSPAIEMPAGSYWKARIGYNDSLVEFAPEGLTLTYILSYANGAVTNDIASFELIESGIGFWVIGDDFVVS